MATLSVSVPNDLKDKMNKFEEVNWSAVARKAFEEKVKQVDFLEKLAKKSKLTKEGAREISRKISRSMAEKFKGM